MHLLEAEDLYFNTESAILLPDLPATKIELQPRNFSNASLWKLLEIFHPELTNDILNKDFSPSETEENQDFLRE